MPAKGNIGFISQSGAFCAAIIDWARSQGFGFSRLVSLGNQADVNETDVLPILSKDEHTRVIVLYLESVADGRRFIQMAQEVSRTKPVIALKVGRFEAGQKAAASHTGALAGSDMAFEAAFQRAGILRAGTAEQMFDWARALEAYPLPAGRRMAVLTNAGGPGVIAADALEVNGLALAALGQKTQQSLAAILPPAASVHNPVDMLASASPEQYALCLNILLEDKNVDGALVILPPPPMFAAENVARRLAGIIQPSQKPVAIALMGSSLVKEAQEVFRTQGIPTYPFPERAASALSALAKRAKLLAGVAGNPTYLEAAARQQDSDWLPSRPEELIAAYGIGVAPIQLAKSVEEALSIAEELGFPVVMKVASPDIPHKSDIGGVALDLKDELELQSAYAGIIRNVQKFSPLAQLEGVHLQRQVPSGQDVIVGMVRDPLFGPLLMFGSGGIEVEGLKDVAFALAPLEEAEGREMLQKTWAGKKLKGFRSIAPADEASVVEVLLRLSDLALENPQVQEIEINPLRVLEHGAIALDVRMIMTRPEQLPGGQES